MLKLIDATLGLSLLSSKDITAQQKQLIKNREQARASSNFASSDQIRNQLKEQGIEIRDTDYGPIWSKS